MTFIAQPKKEGETKECPNCKKTIVARLKEYKDFPSKIQWQNEKETKAHYDKDGNCKGGMDDFEGDVITTKTTLETTTTETIPDYLPDDDKDHIKKTAQTLWHIRCTVETTIKDLEVNPNGGMIWEMTKIIYDELYGDKK